EGQGPRDGAGDRSRAEVRWLHRPQGDRCGAQGLRRQSEGRSPHRRAARRARKEARAQSQARGRQGQIRRSQGRQEEVIEAVGLSGVSRKIAIPKTKAPAAVKLRRVLFLLERAVDQPRRAVIVTQPFLYSL